ncbi:MAG: hypothetical protein JNK67_31155 [Alphaproteobacteria bacterium]|nr:hypothetical protein [Alphaproteobacteria bacterium]
MRSIGGALRLVAALLVLGSAAAAAAQALLDFSAEERAAIARHGPWPQPWAGDPSNRVSMRPAAIELGRLLFFDPRLSANGAVACATCHRPDRGWADGLPVSTGLARGDRNAPGLANVRLQRWFGWDGAQDSLWAQSLRPLLDAREMGATRRGVAAHLRGEPELSCRYRAAFGAPPGDDDEEVFVDAGKALAAFQSTIASVPAAFDVFRDALAAGDATAADYPLAAQRGLRLFIGRGQCSLCHFGPAFTNGEFADIGVPFFTGPGSVDSGRHGGIRRLQSSPYSLLGRFSDARDPAVRQATELVAFTHRNFGEFRVPGLRELLRTAPFMHDGSLPDLHAVVRRYSTLDEDRLHADGERILRRLDLSDAEIDDVVAFLGTLTAADSPQPAPPSDEACR